MPNSGVSSAAKNIKKDLRFPENYGIIDNMNGKNNNYNPLGKTLHDVEEAKRSLNYEVGTLISPDGKVIKEYIGEAHIVSISDIDNSLFDGNIFTHNHPAGRCFTRKDIQSFIAGHLREARISTPQGIFFSLKESNGEINRAIVNIMKEEKVGDMAKAAQILEEKGLDLSGVERENKIYDIMGEEVDKWLSENAKEFGYIYTKGEI